MALEPRAGRLVDDAFATREAGVFSFIPWADGEALAFRCPICGRYRSISLNQGNWTWNGNREAPTCEPSIKAIRSGTYAQCGFHGYITDGVWTFCDDTACDPGPVLPADDEEP
jgi:hypothetical protein